MQGKRGDWDNNELLKKSRFKVFTEDDKEIRFGKSAQMARKANSEHCNTKLQLCKGLLVRSWCKE